MGVGEGVREGVGVNLMYGFVVCVRAAVRVQVCHTCASRLCVPVDGIVTEVGRYGCVCVMFRACVVCVRGVWGVIRVLCVVRRSAGRTDDDRSTRTHTPMRTFSSMARHLPKNSSALSSLPCLWYSDPKLL